MPGLSECIGVSVRVRPLDETEVAVGAKYAVRCKGQNTVISESAHSHPTTDKAFTFDNSFWSGEPGLSENEYASQSFVYKRVGRPLLTSTFEGYHTCLVAYGQTGSGKTFTMMGSDEEPGIIPRVCEDMFQRIVDYPSTETSFRVEVSYYEIITERIRCLLTDLETRKDARVREHPLTGPVVEGLTSCTVTDFDDVHRWMMVGNQSRTVAATQYNQHSSRSHTIFTLALTQSKMDEEGNCKEMVSKITFVDLAGSEHVLGPSGELREEALSINKSLSTLVRVIQTLAEERDRERRALIDFRESSLTWVLKNQLIGKSKTMLLATLSPATTNYEESLNTLRVASQVKRIEAEPIIQEDRRISLLNHLRAELQGLRSQAIDPRMGRASGEEELTEGELADMLVNDLDQVWQERFFLAQNILKERSLQFERDMMARANAAGYAVGELPLLININPHPVPGEQLAHVIRPGETYLGTDDEAITEETKDDIRLLDGFNLSNPHCIFEQHETGEVEIIPLNGSLSYVNGQLLTTTFILTHGCRIVLGSNHVFMFVDPVHSRAFREAQKASAQGIPRIVDWNYSSREFADAMGILCKPEQLSSLREDCDQLRDEVLTLKETNEALYRQFEEYRLRPFLVLLASSSNPTPNSDTERVCWRLNNGRNTIGFGGDINPPGAKQLVFLDYNNKTGHVCLVTGHRSASSPIPNGHRITSGDCAFQLVIPASDRHVELETKPNGTRGFLSGPLSPTSSARDDPIGDVLGGGRSNSSKLHLDPAYEDHLFFEDLKQKLFDFQFAVLNMRDQLFPPPPEYPQEGEDAPQLTPEEIELNEKRRVLKDDWLLTSKKCTSQDFLDHISYLQHELRYLTFVSAQREQLVDQLQFAVENGPAAELEAELERVQSECMNLQTNAIAIQKRMDRELHEKDTEIIKCQRLLREKDSAMAALQQQLREVQGSARTGASPKVKKLEPTPLVSGAPRTDEDLKRRLMTAQIELQQSKDGLNKQDQEMAQLKRQFIVMEERANATDSLREELRRKDTAMAELRLKLQSLTQEGIMDTEDEKRRDEERANLEETKRKMKEVQTKLESITGAHSALVDSYNALLKKQGQMEERSQTQDLDLNDMDTDTKSSLKKNEISSIANNASLPKDSIKAFNKMKDTIKLLTKVAKSKDDKISKLEKEIQDKNTTITTLNQRLSDQESSIRRINEVAGNSNLSFSSYSNSWAKGDGEDSGDTSGTQMERLHELRTAMDSSMGALKGEVILLSRTSLATLDKIVAAVPRNSQADLFKKAYASVRKVIVDLAGEQGSDGAWSVTDKELDKVKTSQRSSVLKHLREMVVCYDMLGDYLKGGVITYEEIQRNTLVFLKLARICVAHEKNRPDVSPSRSGTKVSSDKDAVKRSSSASSNRSNNVSISSTGRDVSPFSKKITNSTYSNVPSRVAAYISPKRSSPTPPPPHTAVPQHMPIRHPSPRHGTAHLSSFSKAAGLSVSRSPTIAYSTTNLRK